MDLFNFGSKKELPATGNDRSLQAIWSELTATIPGVHKIKTFYEKSIQRLTNQCLKYAGLNSVRRNWPSLKDAPQHQPKPGVVSEMVQKFESVRLNQQTRSPKGVFKTSSIVNSVLFKNFEENFHQNIEPTKSMLRSHQLNCNKSFTVLKGSLSSSTRMLDERGQRKMSDKEMEQKQGAIKKKKNIYNYSTDTLPSCSCETPQTAKGDFAELDYIYTDSDNHGQEIAELYSYTEQDEFQLNLKAFEDQMGIYNLPASWQGLPIDKRKDVIMKLLNQLESADKLFRMRSARCILYIAQGCWAELHSNTEQEHWSRVNSLMLFQLDTFAAFIDLLNIELDDSTAAYVPIRAITISLSDSEDLRVILSVLYTLTEVVRIEQLHKDSEYKSKIESFVCEIGHAEGDDNLVVKLLSMVMRFFNGATPHFPIKKVLLLVWKLILLSLGGMQALRELKAEKRRQADLPPQNEDTVEVAQMMKSFFPATSAFEHLKADNQKRSTYTTSRNLTHQGTLDEQSLREKVEVLHGNESSDNIIDPTKDDERRSIGNTETGQMLNTHNLNMSNMQLSPLNVHEATPRGPPWKLKVRQSDIDSFMETSRIKFLGNKLPLNQSATFGLPRPIQEGISILNKHGYTSLAELQIKKEAQNPMSMEEEDFELTPTKILYQAMLPNLSQYMIALLKILLSAAPSSKAKTSLSHTCLQGSINIIGDVVQEELPTTILKYLKLEIDINRHKEIIIKAVSAILLLLLKHFKLDHIYQFEFMSQSLVLANCIPLVLKFFNQNIMAYVGTKNSIPILDFPACVIGDQPELTTQILEIGDAAPFARRNMFSCINLLRVLNKLTKWKNSRIMMLVEFKSAPILRRLLHVRHAVLQLYVLKLLKMQSRYLGKEWRKSNMKTVGAIYHMVRHRLNDDWAYGNDLDVRPDGFDSEDWSLRASVDKFHNRRYAHQVSVNGKSVENTLNSRR